MMWCGDGVEASGGWSVDSIGVYVYREWVRLGQSGRVGVIVRGDGMATVLLYMGIDDSQSIDQFCGDGVEACGG